MYIEQLIDEQILSYIDYAVATSLLKAYPESTEENALFICCLFKASREGHLCLSLSDEGTVPSLCGIDFLKILHGAKTLPSGLMTGTGAVIHCFGSSYYLQRNWEQESLLISCYHKALHAQPRIVFNKDCIEKRLNELKEARQLLEEQAHAIFCALQQTVTLIVGGPGTGKTYTAGKLIQIYWEQLSPEQQKYTRIVLAAPTGKATANVEASVINSMGGVAVPVLSKTLHSLLGISSSMSAPILREAKMIDADLVVIDESSMLDLRMICLLLQALKPGTRLILLGDPHQLPAVESGAVFSDLITYGQSLSHVCVLSTCMRAELHTILDIAKAINRGNSEEALSLLMGKEMSCAQADVSRLLLSSMRTGYQALSQHALPAFPVDLSSKQDDPSTLLKQYQQFRMLSPLRRGPYGCEELNAHFFNEDMKRQKEHSWWIAPIMLTRNDHSLGLFNGTVGLLVKRKNPQTSSEKWSNEDYALFADSQATGGVRKVAAFLLPHYEYAYCLSVHKSQGSEFDRVLVLLPEGSEKFGREMVYTAVTRARKQLQIWCSDATFHATIAQRSLRQSNIVRRLQEL